MARLFRHAAHHVPLRGIGRHIHDAAAHSGLAGAASPQAGAMPLMCAQAPGGLLPLGPIPGAYGPAYASGVGGAGNGVATGGWLGSAAAAGGVSGGGLPGGGGLAGSFGALASTVLLAGALALAALPAATTASDQLAAQQSALADMMQPLPFIAAPFIPLLAATASAMMPASTGASDMTPDSITPGAVTPGVAALADPALADPAPGATAAFAVAAPNDPTSVPEPASLALLGIAAAATWATRRRPSRH